MKRILFFIGILSIFLSGTMLHAQARSWNVDKAHSGFYFNIDHIFSKTFGFFNDYEVEMQFDPNNLNESKVVFTIKVDSIDTNIAKRDKHLRSADFFDAGKYPTMTFTSTSITENGNNSYNVAGKFEVKGQSYDLTLPLTLAGIKAHPTKKGQDVMGFNGSLTLDRLAYKVGTGKFVEYGVIGKDVDITISLELLAKS